MKTQTFTYAYDPTIRQLTIFIDGKARGGFFGPDAERQFNKLLDSGAEINITAMNAEQFKKNLIRNFHAALASQGIMDHKQSILSGFGVESTSDLTIDQLKEAVATYSTGERKPVVPAKSDDPQVRAMRSEMLTICNKMGIYATNDDWSTVNRFFSDPRIAGKPLNRLSYEELTALVPKMRSILSKHLVKQREIERQKLGN
jgi:hypothetical protein